MSRWLIWLLWPAIAGAQQTVVAAPDVSVSAALANLRKICEEHLDGQYKLHVIDLIKTPQLAQNDQILAIPTLVRKLPEPIRKIIGDLSDRKRVLVGLNLRETEGVE